MNSELWQTAVRRISAAGITSLLLATGATNASAQLGSPTWQATFHYTIPVVNDYGRSVCMLQNGSIAAGETRVLDDDIYLVRNDLCYHALWEYAYDFGGNEQVGRIRELSDGFLIVGTTNNKRRDICPYFNQIFLLKVDVNGGVQWGHLYGGEGDEAGYDVQVLPNGAGYIIAGETNSAGGGGKDAYLIKTDLSGNLLWDKAYGGIGDESFRTCTVASNGDIIAAGGTTTYWGPTNRDIFLGRVDQATGAMLGGFPRHYDGDDGQDEIAFSVLEDGRDIILAGGTFSYLYSSEAFLLRTDPVGAPIDMKLYGSANGWDEFLDMVRVGRDFAVAGRFYNAPGGWGDFDMYVARVNGVFALQSSMLHGGTGDDQGWGISTITGSEAVMVAGFTDSYGAGLKDMYQVRQNIITGTSGCNDRVPDLNIRDVEIENLFALIPTPASLDLDCAVDPARNLKVQYEDLLCTSCDDDGRNISGPAIGQDLLPRTERQTLAPASSLSTAGVTDNTTAGDLKIYPNPVAAQHTLVLEHKPVQGATMTLTVSDIAGGMVSSQQHSASSGRLEISTIGWAAGTYIVRMTIGEATQTRRITVLGN